MRHGLRPILIELIWLTVSFVASCLFCLFIFGPNLLSGNVDIQLYDTYFVVSPFWAVFPLFLLIAFLIFLIKEWLNRFSRKLPNLILLTLGLLLIGLFSVISRFR